jgi:hypothetical protein
MNTLWLVDCVAFSSIGAGYLLYAWRQKDGLFLAAGAALSVVPFLISNPYVSTGVGLVLLIAPFVIRRYIGIG